MVLARNALQGMDAAILEPEAGAGNQLGQGPRNEDLGRSRQRGDPGTDMHGQAADLAADQLGLADVRAHTHVDAEGRTSSTIAQAHRTAAAGSSNAARTPSPAVSTSRPRRRRRASRTTR
jgi:hypothetical protein